MAAEIRRTNVRVDRDGVRIIETSGVRPSVWLMAIVLVAVALGLFFVRRSSNNGDQQTATSSQNAAPAKVADAPRQAQPPKFRPVHRAEPREEPPRPPADARAQTGSAPAGDGTAAESDDGDADTPTGIALFPPPGTDPLKRGLIVPEDFELPPGYVRHYQATDEGQRLPAILMFHPDYDWVDTKGNRVDVPADGIVPPELAPAGMPLQTLDVPEVIVPMIEESGDGEAGH